MRPDGEGWLYFAGTVLGIAGIMRVFDSFGHSAITARARRPRSGIFGHSLTTYGWVYLIVGIILIVSSFGVLARSQISRWIGIVAGAVMAISAVWWMPFYPVWSLLYIFTAFLVIYSLTAYGAKETV